MVLGLAGCGDPYPPSGALAARAAGRGAAAHPAGEHRRFTSSPNRRPGFPPPTSGTHRIEIVRVQPANELVWTADGTRLPDYVRPEALQGFSRGPVHFIEGKICPEGCAFEVRFGSKDGERRAYLTVDYGHDNPGTLVDVEVAGAALVVTQTTSYPPGTFSLSGVVTEVTPRGSVVRSKVLSSIAASRADGGRPPPTRKVSTRSPGSTTAPRRCQP